LIYLSYIQLNGGKDTINSDYLCAKFFLLPLKNYEVAKIFPLMDKNFFIKYLGINNYKIDFCAV